MAHFAKIDRTGTVVDVVVVDDAVLKGEDGSEIEQKGVNFLTELFGGEPQWDWKQTSYNACKGEHRFQPAPASYGDEVPPIFGSKPCLRKNYAAVGGKYDYKRDAFIPPRHNGTHVILDEKACHWECPYQSNQVNDNNGIPLGYKDESDYTVNSLRNPKGWIWDENDKTYKQVLAFEEKRVNYQFDPQQHMWVQQSY
tara:strand:+ start:100 stop:690 length:591 start_codon:yes stop_codon:yes gene_type:complete